MAEVFRAKPLNARDRDRYLAVKRILPHLAEDDEFIAMFIDEARLTVQLRHPNVVQIYELGQFQSSHYIAMEFIGGLDLLALQKHVRRQKTTVDIDMACHIICEVARGMDYVHQKSDEQGRPLGIIHRDISPQNILVSWDGEVRIIDFGIAKAASQSTHTQAGVLKGKYGYMSPEQVRGGVVLDGRSDIFSMGTLFWELLTNRRLFRAANQYEVMAQIGDPQIVAPSEINAAIPAEVDRIAMRALAAEREDRYQRAGELARDLAAYLKSQKPPYHSSQLTSWIRSAFAEEYVQEQEKREAFRDINTAEDVQRLVVAAYGEGGLDGDEEAEEATQIWDVDVLPEADQDLSAYVDDHTVVQAGGLELLLEEDASRADEVVALEVEEEWLQDEDDATRVEGDWFGGADDATRVEGDWFDDADDATRVEGEWGQVPDTVEEEVEISASEVFEVEPTGATIDLVPLSLRTSDLGAAPTPPSGTAAPYPLPELGAGRGIAGSMGFDLARLEPARARAKVSLPRVLVAFLAVGILCSLLAAAFFMGSGESGGQKLSGSLGSARMLVEPSRRLEIRINGAVVGRDAPLELTDLPSGRYDLSITHPEYPQWRGDLVVEPGEVAEVVVDLGAPGELVVSWEEQAPADLELYINGERAQIAGHGVRAEIARGEVFIEAFSREIRPIRRRIFVEADQTTEEVLRWRPPLLLHLAGDRGFDVEINGQPYGKLEVLLQDLSPHRLYHIKVGEVETTLGYPEIGRRRLTVQDLERIANRSREDYGWLTVDPGEGRWHLFIDDVDTGLATPITEADRIPVMAGPRTLGLQRGDQRYHVPVRIHPGETTNSRRRLVGR